MVSLHLRKCLQRTPQTLKNCVSSNLHSVKTVGVLQALFCRQCLIFWIQRKMVSFFTCVNPNSTKMITEDKPKRTSICSNDSNDSSSCVALPTEDPQLLKVILAAIFIIIFLATGIVVFIWRWAAVELWHFLKLSIESKLYCRDRSKSNDQKKKQRFYNEEDPKSGYSG